MKGMVTVDKNNVGEVREIVRILKEDGWLVMVDDTEDGGKVITYFA